MYKKYCPLKRPYSPSWRLILENCFAFKLVNFWGGTFSPTNLLQFCKYFKIVAYLSESNENPKKKERKILKTCILKTVHLNAVHGFDAYIKITSIYVIFFLVWYCRIDQNDLFLREIIYYKLHGKHKFIYYYLQTLCIYIYYALERRHFHIIFFWLIW